MSEDEWDRSVSYSKWSTYNRCGRQFKFSYVDEIEAEADQGREDGIDFHEYMERYYDYVGDVPDAEKAVELAQEMFDPGKQARYRGWIEQWHEWNQWLYQKFGEDHWKPLLTEQWVEVEIDGLTHHGYIDAIRWNPEREEYGVVDYKPEAKDNSRLKGQTAYYAKFLIENDPDLLDEDVEWAGTYGYKDGKYKTWDIHWRSTRATKRKVEDLVELDHGYEPEFGYHCEFCDYMEECVQAENQESSDLLDV
ncbi:MAG: RecB family exonuclease [Halopenitus sp.]